jgi:hypothetical protein
MMCVKDLKKYGLVYNKELLEHFQIKYQNGKAQTNEVAKVTKTAQDRRSLRRKEGLCEEESKKTEQLPRALRFL